MISGRGNVIYFVVMLHYATCLLCVSFNSRSEHIENSFPFYYDSDRFYKTIRNVSKLKHQGSNNYAVVIRIIGMVSKICLQFSFN